MTWVKWLLLLAVVLYGGMVALLYLTQRALQYFPEPFATAPDAVGLPEAEEVVLTTADDERVIAWHVPPRDGQPVVLYFHGNGASLRWREARFRSLIADGTGLVALSYRGYGGSSGTPSEAGLLTDAAAAYAFAAARYGTGRLVLWGESLGSGVAVAIAAASPVATVVLESPFSSAVDVAAARYWFVPVRWLMKDQFRSDLRIGQVSAPVLVMHGDADRIVPFALGERLYGMIRSPKRLVRFPGLGHNELGANGAVDTAKRFIAEHMAPAGAAPGEPAR
jgi:fermentation-respiration switch protein FrsA (DUF1100 family)